MKHECDLDLVVGTGEFDDDGKEILEPKLTSATAKFCQECGRRWFKLDDGTWRMENRADRRASRRAVGRVSRANVRRVVAYRADIAETRAAKSSWAAKRARAGWKAKMAEKHG
jgi:hypothetical protein